MYTFANIIKPTWYLWELPSGEFHKTVNDATNNKSNNYTKNSVATLYCCLHIVNYSVHQNSLYAIITHLRMTNCCPIEELHHSPDGNTACGIAYCPLLGLLIVVGGKPIL